MSLILFALLMFVLLRSGRIGPPPWVRAGDGSGRPARHPFAPPRPEEEARRILAERLARGEIDTDEYLERVSVLDHDRRSPTD